MKPAITRYLNGELRAYQVPSTVDEPLGPVATYRIEPEDEEVLSHAAAPDLNRAVFTTCNKAICIGQDGGMLWRYEFEPHTTQDFPRTACIFSLDGTWVWLYRPDAMTSRGPDLLVVLRADTGEVVARAELDSVGQGAELVQHPDGRHVMLDVGEGQDGVKLFLAALTDGGIDLRSYGWDDQVLVDIAPGGWFFMTIDDCRSDVAFRAFPSGEVVLHLPITAFGYEDDDSLMDWNGGFLSPDIAVVTITGELDNKSWHHHYKVNLRTGKPLDRFEAHSRDSYDLKTLGDGTWIVSDLDGNPIRHR
jgi:hypothetical protein